jgi:hypothetical protein
MEAAMDIPVTALPEWLVWCTAASAAGIALAAVVAMLLAAFDLEGEAR